MIVAGSTLSGHQALRAKVVVVGSGAGGSLVAMRLAEAGHDVLVLEAGPHVPARRMNQRERDMMRLLYHEGGLRASEDLGVGVLHGRVVGGSTVVNYLDCFRTPDRLLETWVRGRGLPELAPAKMAPRFDRIFDILHVRKLGEDQLNPNNRKLMEGARALGWKGDTFHRNAWNCMGSGFCDLGCAYNAKQSAALTFLPLAAAKGARIYSECRVDRVVFEGETAVAVEGATLGEDRAPTGSFRAEADVFVIAGGAVETPHLLLRSGAPDPSGQLGHNLHLHPGSPVVGHFKGEHIAAYEGIKQGWYVSEFSWPVEGHPDDFLLEGVAAPPGIASTVFAGTGDERLATLRRFNEFAVVGVLLRDQQPGRVEVGPGRPLIHYRLGAADAARLQRGIGAAAQAFLAAGAQLAVSPHTPPLFLRRAADFQRLWGLPMGPGQVSAFSFHQMGTARMGASRAQDVTDPTGRMWGVRNLHVADASLFPTASGVNPQITVYGLADVVGDALLARL